MVAFGIPICSRYGKAIEIISMIELSMSLAKNDINQCLFKIWIDSKCGVITLDLDASIRTDIRKFKMIEQEFDKYMGGGYFIVNFVSTSIEEALEEFSISDFPPSIYNKSKSD